MSERIDFTDRGIIPIYEEVAQGNVRALETFLSSMESLCRRHSYKPLVDFTNKVIDFYNGEFRDHVMRTFNSWCESDFSLDRLAIRCGAGSGAASTGRRYMEELRSSLEGMFRSRFQRISVDTDMPELDEKDILSTNEEITRLMSTAESVKDEAVSQCNSRSGQNMLYLLIAPVIRNTGESMCGCFRSMIAKVVEGSELYSRGVISTIDSIQTGGVMDNAGFAWPNYDDFI